MAYAFLTAPSLRAARSAVPQNAHARGAEPGVAPRGLAGQAEWPAGLRCEGRREDRGRGKTPPLAGSGRERDERALGPGRGCGARGDFAEDAGAARRGRPVWRRFSFLFAFDLDVLCSVLQLGLRVAEAAFPPWALPAY